MAQMQNGMMITGSGSDDPTFSNLANATPMTEDDLKRQPSRNIIPRFFTETVGIADGGFKEIEMVELLVPGDPKSAPICKVRDEIIKRFPIQYRAWKSGLAQASTGTPVELVVGTGSLMHHLKALHIHTVEALADLTDGQLPQLGTGARAMRDRAKKVLEMQATAKEAAKEEAKDKEIADLKAMVLAQGEQMKILTAKANQPVPAVVAKAGGEEDEDDKVGDGKKVPDGAHRVTDSKPLKRVRRGGR